MKRLLISSLAVAAASVALTACGTSGSSNSSGSNSSGAGQASGGMATVAAKQLGSSGNVLVDSSGRALYTNDQEKGMVKCTGACVSIWKPLTVKGAPTGNSISGTLGVVKRPDGTKQVTFDGKLLYTFYLDQPGKVGADGFKDAFGGHHFTWHVVHSNGATTSSGASQNSGSGSLGY